MFPWRFYKRWLHITELHLLTCACPCVLMPSVPLPLKRLTLAHVWRCCFHGDLIAHRPPVLIQSNGWFRERAQTQISKPRMCWRGLFISSGDASLCMHDSCNMCVYVGTDEPNGDAGSWCLSAETLLSVIFFRVLVVLLGLECVKSVGVYVGCTVGTRVVWYSIVLEHGWSRDILRTCF